MGLIARQAEESGISTVCMSSALDIIRTVNPPRAVFLDFPLGHTSGKAHDPDLQYAVIRDAFTALEEMTTPGSIKRLAYSWGEDESWRDTHVSDARLDRTPEPQFQCEADRIAYERKSERSDYRTV